jgi:hypothetical protein
VNEQILASSYVSYCESLLALKRSGDWKAWFESWDEYVKARWGLSKSRAKQICAFIKMRQLFHEETFGFGWLPETPEQVKSILALPQKQWLETWELVLNDNALPISPQNVDSTLERFHIYPHKKLSPEALKAIRVRRAAKTMAEMNNGAELVAEIGGRALGTNWQRAVAVVIEADEARMNEAVK